MVCPRDRIFHDELKFCHYDCTPAAPGECTGPFDVIYCHEDPLLPQGHQDYCETTSQWAIEGDDHMYRQCYSDDYFSQWHTCMYDCGYWGPSHMYFCDGCQVGECDRRPVVELIINLIKRLRARPLDTED